MTRTPSELPREYEWLRHGRWSGQDHTSAVARIPYTSMMLSRGPCFGDCPVYQVELHRDGNAKYTGERFSERTGNFTGTVDAVSYGRLAYFLDVVEFMRMDELFDSTATCVSAVTVTAVRHTGERKVVTDHGSAGPPQLWAIQELIDAVSHGIRWRKVTSRARGT